jgi:hypothetical protein
VRVTFQDGKTFIAPIKQIQLSRIFDKGQTLKISCNLNGKVIGMGVNYKETPNDFFDPVLLLAIMSPKVSTIKWA